MFINLLNKKIKFIDLYAGIGGFHQGLSKLGHECVWASEINENLHELYKKNYPSTPIDKNILKTDIKLIPKHDLLTAGFPCQPFSRAGNRLGFVDQQGNHFFKILEILKHHDTPYFILENVETIKKHDSGNTFKIIINKLEELNYDVLSETLSPHEFNIPQHRRRTFIVGKKKNIGGLKEFIWPKKKDISKTSINTLTFKSLPNENLFLDIKKEKVISVWEDFVLNFPNPNKFPSFPIWAHEFGANYEYENITPFKSSAKELIGKKGAFGIKIPEVSKQKILANYIPRYSNSKTPLFPKWKINFIRKNRDFYNSHKDYIDSWIHNLDGLEFSHQKFEWTCKGEKNTFDDKLLQFRPSGLRVKKNNWIPALTTIKTQSVFIKKINRKLSILELCQLQSLEFLHYPDHENGGIKAMGNSVNATIVSLIAKKLIK